MKPSQKVRDAIDKLRKEELSAEINLGRASKFSRAMPYMQDRFARIEAGQVAGERGEDVSIAKTGNRLTTYLVIVGLLTILAIIAYR